MKKLDWVNNIWDQTIDFENSYLISKADDKFIFLAFCLEMRRFNPLWYIENIHEFKTYSPIQLDGTCYGFQHLALPYYHMKYNYLRL